MSDTDHKQHGYISLHRLDGFSDAVFAFAVTLLVVSLEVPKSAHELFHLMHGFIAFGVAFTLLMVMWYQHGKFFKRFPITDLWMISLNMALLFVILLYVYPLKFLFVSLFDSMIWKSTGDNFTSASEIQTLMTIYGAGIIAVNFVFFLMHKHAWRLRERFAMSLSQLNELRADMAGNLINMAVAGLSVLIVLVSKDQGTWSGCIYFLLGPAHWASGAWHGRRYRAIKNQEQGKQVKQESQESPLAKQVGRPESIATQPSVPTTPIAPLPAQQTRKPG
ncbi:TMEM175 family protein [Undibacterium pigrum]|uniref:Putative membrane protein n=1 Tax=Undibacterium pigrum TaxID=401470 RepID=A0A318IXI5_9BURK|nr:TMEM175 family protein [Undibacterium pigrum]PXX40179.1 putative membrane protein [Undibacterium pigrum]